MNAIRLVLLALSLVVSSEQQNDGNDYIHHCNPIFQLNQYFDGVKGETRVISSSGTLNQPLPKDCAEVRDRDNAESGQYIISPQDDGPAFRVYCDMETDGGGWTVFQRREDGSVDFFLDWNDYASGFGNVNSEHWLGNEKIHRISAQGSYELRIDMADFDGNTSYAKYDKFRLGNGGTNYKLILGSYSGNSGNSLSDHGGHPFTTRDRDHDTLEGGNCANSYKGGWWYTACHSSNLNGLYLGGPHDSYANGVNWSAWKGNHYSLKHVEMKMRLINNVDACNMTLGMEDSHISDSQITASSTWTRAGLRSYGASNARLNRPGDSLTTGAWSAQTSDLNQWIQVFLGSSHRISGIITQGRSDIGDTSNDQYVSRYKVQYSDNDITWSYVRNGNDQDVEFIGNSDPATPVTNIFNVPVQAKFVRIQPTRWNVHISMRFELLGCRSDRQI